MLTLKRNLQSRSQTSSNFKYRSQDCLVTSLLFSVLLFFNHQKSMLTHLPVQASKHATT